MSTMHGFSGSFYALNKRAPTLQEIFDEGVAEGKRRSTAPTTGSEPEQWKAGDDTSSVQISRDGSTHKWGCKCGGCATTIDSPAASVLTDAFVDEVMEQAQVFASAWSLVGGPFDSGDMMETALVEKANLRALLAASMGGDGK